MSCDKSERKFWVKAKLIGWHLSQEPPSVDRERTEM